jgi:uncharacterized membrane protein
LSSGSQSRSGILAGAGAVLLAVGIFVSTGWPFVLGGFILLVVAAGSRRA